MKEDLQSYLKKIRSDAAECLVLGGLVTDDKRAVFIRTGEHLNGLASELEKSISKIGPDVAGAVRGQEDADFNPPPAAAPSSPAQRAEKPRRVLIWMLGMVSGAIFATLIFAISPTQTYWSATNAKHDPAPLPWDNPNQAMTQLVLSSTRAERESLTDQISAIADRLGGVERSLDDLKKARAEVVEPTNTASLSAPKATVAERPDNPNQAMVQLLLSTAQAERERLTDQIAAIAGLLGGLESSIDDLKRARAGVEPTNTASIPVPKAPATETSPSPVERPVSTTDHSLDNPPLPKQSGAVGPRGCDLFRSFDPISGTYVTFDGRRRQCR